MQECEAADDELDAAYKKFFVEQDKNRSQEQLQNAMEAFLRLVLQRAEESRKANLVNDETSAPDISFAPLNYRLTEGFVGRTDLLQEISDVMKEHGFAVLCGIGGLGKSQTALRYAENGKRSKVYHQVQMVYFHQDLKMTIQEISFQGMKKYQKEEKAGDEGFRIRMDALKTFHADTLLIIDNMDIMGASLRKEDQSVLEELASMEMHVLITSRNTALYKEMYMIPIKPLTEEEQLELFRLNYSPRKEKPIELPTKNIDLKLRTRKTSRMP